MSENEVNAKSLHFALCINKELTAFTCVAAIILHVHSLTPLLAPPSGTL